MFIRMCVNNYCWLKSLIGHLSFFDLVIYYNLVVTYEESTYWQHYVPFAWLIILNPYRPPERFSCIPGNLWTHFAEKYRVVVTLQSASIVPIGMSVDQPGILWGRRLISRWFFSSKVLITPSLGFSASILSEESLWKT